MAENRKFSIAERQEMAKVIEEATREEEEKILTLQVTGEERNLLVDALYYYDGSLCCVPLAKGEWASKTKVAISALVTKVSNMKELF